MLSRYPDQAATRKGFALVGAIFAIFGVAMAVFEATFMAVVAIGLATALLAPAIFFGYSSYARVERVLSRVFAGW